AVDVNSEKTEGGEFDHRAERAADQALDLDGAAVRSPTGHVPRASIAGRRGQHPVLGRDPAAAGALTPGRHSGDERCCTDHARTPDGDERRAACRANKPGPERHPPWAP